jgi:Rrf2 family transcriptional regulator, iron-sulfur cluster assembly transcription factor
MMNISTRGRYATRILVLMAREPQRARTKFQIAEAEGITAAYVQQLMMALRLAGLVHSLRGRSGGFILARTPDAITVADVMGAVEGLIMPAPCGSPAHCDRAESCPTRPLWTRASELLDGLFSTTTIAALAAAVPEPPAVCESSAAADPAAGI